MNAFNPYDYVFDHFSEAINYMTDDEIAGIAYCLNEDDVIIYMQEFQERT